VALRSGQLSEFAVVSVLRGLAIIHSLVEQELSKVTEQRIATIAQQAIPKIPLLTADLNALDAKHTPSIRPAIECALEFGAAILEGANDPLNLVGVLYVLEGSQNGGIALKRHYGECLRMTEAPLSYFGCYGHGTAAHWRRFGELLDSLKPDGEQSAKVIRSAKSCFGRPGEIYAASCPYVDKDLKHHVAAINFGAGNHAMPQDPREIDLALRAGNATWRRYPYLEHRFGERGKRFSCSDSCWLVNLSRVPIETVTKSLKWLRTVLATRGIPTITLEHHLHAISHALKIEFSAQIEIHTRFDRFLPGRDMERRRLDGSGRVSRLVSEFDPRFRGCIGPGIDSSAELIASAWIDDQSGINGALGALRNWLTDTGRFSRDWSPLSMTW
jgi:heme oxygenase